MSNSNQAVQLCISDVFNKADSLETFAQILKDDTPSYLHNSDLIDVLSPHCCVLKSSIETLEMIVDLEEIEDGKEILSDIVIDVNIAVRGLFVVVGAMEEGLGGKIENYKIANLLSVFSNRLKEILERFHTKEMQLADQLGVSCIESEANIEDAESDSDEA